MSVSKKEVEVWPFFSAVWVFCQTNDGVSLGELCCRAATVGDVKRIWFFQLI